MNQFRQYNINKKKSPTVAKLIIGVIILLIFQYIYFGFLAKPAIESNNEAIITISQGESLKSIAKKLKEENVINSKLLFLTYAKFSDQDTQIKSGVFRIPLPQNIPSTLFFLVTNTPQEQRVTIPEGYKITQIDQALANLGLINEGEFTDCTKNCDLSHPILDLTNQTNPEGFLFPDTYFVSSETFSSEELIYKMLDNFESKLPTNWQSLAANLPEKDLYSAIKMASIIEREVLSDTDKKMVSGILWKRYESDWTLGADATLLYEKDNNSITAADIQGDSPYNTRKFLGLPPTPIANPGLESIIAALNPIASQHWFYLTTLDTGEVIYADTNDQHNANKAKYL